MGFVTSFDPRTGAVVGTVSETSHDEVRQLTRRAAGAAEAVAAAPLVERRGWLRAIADGVDACAEELVRIADRETGLGAARLIGEVARVAGQLRFYADVAAEGSHLAVTIDEETENNPWLGRVNRPLGAVAVFGASNFPFAFSVLGNDTASALAAGCPVVVKAHPAHALLSERLSEIAQHALRRAGAPEGTLAMVAGVQAGVDLVTAAEITAVGFTGSQRGGMALWCLANERETVIPVYAEMGTVNPVVLTPASGHLIDVLAKGFVDSFTLGSGQYCTKPGLMLAPRSALAPQAVARALRDSSVAPVMLTESIAEEINRSLSELQEAGAEVVESLEATGEGWSANAAVLSAPIDALVPGSRLLEECFGAVALVVEYDDIDDVLSALDRLQGALVASVMSDGKDDIDAASLVRKLSARVGRVAVNSWPTGVAYSWAQQHGGPWPATSHPGTTSVGAAALDRWVRPVTYQGVPDSWLPEPLRASNPWHVPRRVNGRIRPPEATT